MDRPISWVATRAIAAFPAARDAKRGVFVSGAAVDAWIDSRGAPASA